MMSARSNREDLFMPSSRREGKEESKADRAPSSRGQAAEPYDRDDGAGEDTGNPLQLEHMIGFGASNPQAVLTLTGSDGLFIKSMDRLVSVENLNDPNEQYFLRGHDMQVSALAVSPGGSMMASGQLGTRSFKGYAAPVFVWDTYSRRRTAILRGLSQKVNIISFSPDEKLVCGCGEDCLLYVWELATGEVIFGKQFPTPVTFMTWVDHKTVNRKVTYEIAYGLGPQVFQGILYFEAERVQWTIKSTAYAMPPSGGLIRSFCCGTMSLDKNYLYVGTNGAEMMVYCRASKPIFRGAIPVSNHGIRSILALPDGSVVCGGGDGLLKKLEGEDLSWEILSSVELGGCLSSLSMTRNGDEMVVGSSLGVVHRCSTGDFSLNTIVSCCHLASIKCLAFGSRSDQFVSGSSNGELRVWDLSDYACLASLFIPKSGAVLSTCIVDPDEGISSSVGIGGSAVVSGWQDGTIRCHDMQTLNRQIWQIPNAHRGGVTCVAVHCTGSLQYMVTGGADGVVRIWRLSNRELVVQFSEHSKTVTSVLVDVLKPNLVHSASLDMSVLTYDLKTQRRTVSHLVQRGSFADMTQRVDSEQELVTCDNMGCLLHWDCDVREPVAVIQDPSGFPLSCCVVSPSGKFIAFAGQDATLKVLTIQTNEVVGIGQGHSDAITKIRWTPDEKQIVTVGDDSCICVWNLYV